MCMGGYALVMISPYLSFRLSAIDRLPAIVCCQSYGCKWEMLVVDCFTSCSLENGSVLK